MQLINLSGRLGKDAAEIASKNGGEGFISFSLACDAVRKGEKKTTWYEIIVMHSKKHDAMLPYLKKGSAVIVSGDLDAQEYEGSNGKGIRLSVLANHIEFNGGDKKENNEGETKTTEDKPKKTTSKKTSEVPEDIPMTSSDATDGDDNDDLPF